VRLTVFVMTIPIIDLFAGPGGLGEGFSSLDDGRAFKIIVSAEMETSAHKTLSLRSYFRRVRHNPRDARRYYRFCNGDAPSPYDSVTEAAWEDAQREARQFELGKPSDNDELDAILDNLLSADEECVLIGGPPCQAYSLVGRSRNLGKAGYKAEEDHRHFLYKEYLRIIRSRRPAVFVMENVKGILSAKVDGEKIFHHILKDLCDPGAALGEAPSNFGYKICSLVTDTTFEKGMDVSSIDPRDFIIKAEEHGLPQARHRVILLGIRSDINVRAGRLSKNVPSHLVEDVLSGLPALRSSLTREQDSSSVWANTVIDHLRSLAAEANAKGDADLSCALLSSAFGVKYNLETGSNRFSGASDSVLPLELREWYLDPNLNKWLNHEARAHMTSDLRRYAYAATFAELRGFSPKGHQQFDLSGLRPDHDNWETGKFADRFKVQRYGAHSTTITSHIAKDGHYFIHPDATQCRSLTVREAARLQTFPDNYFFMGNRTEQFHQVGNAVPPLLANRIASLVKNVLV